MDVGSELSDVVDDIDSEEPDYEAKASIKGLPAFGSLSVTQTKAAALIGRGYSTAAAAELAKISRENVNSVGASQDFLDVVSAHRKLWASETLSRVARGIDGISAESPDAALKIIQAVEKLVKCGSGLAEKKGQPDGRGDAAPAGAADDVDEEEADEEFQDVEIYRGPGDG